MKPLLRALAPLSRFAALRSARLAALNLGAERKMN